MSEMVRKQFYINRRQEILLRRLAHLRGSSQAEIIRQAIEREAGQIQPMVVDSGRSPWEETVKFMEERKKLGVTGEPYRWNRQEIYEERENRWVRDRKEGKE